MEFLINAVNNAPKLEAKALAISAIGATGMLSDWFFSIFSDFLLSAVVLAI